MRSPAATAGPRSTPTSLWWQYQSTVPSSSRTTVLLPKAPSYAVGTTSRDRWSGSRCPRRQRSRGRCGCWTRARWTDRSDQSGGSRSQAAPTAGGLAFSSDAAARRGMAIRVSAAGLGQRPGQRLSAAASAGPMATGGGGEQGRVRSSGRDERWRNLEVSCRGWEFLVAPRRRGCSPSPGARLRASLLV